MLEFGDQNTRDERTTQRKTSHICTGLLLSLLLDIKLHMHSMKLYEAKERVPGEL